MAPQTPEHTPTPTTSSGKTVLLWSAALLVVLMAGVVLGYLFSQAQKRPVQVVVTATSIPGAQVEEQSQKESEAAADTADRSNTPPTPSIMDFVLSDARHFQGSENAPITMIEFSDFK